MTYWNTIFKEWQAVQQHIIDNLPMKLMGIEYPNQPEHSWELPHLQTFISWGQSAVRQSMELQTSWLEQWGGQMDNSITVSEESNFDMIKRLQESMGGWSENQTELWEYWFKMIEGTAESMNDSDSAIFHKNISSWKSTVEESLGSQSKWLEQSKKINIEELTPEEIRDVSTKILETMDGWLGLQKELWHQWFDFLNLSGFAKST